MFWKNKIHKIKETKKKYNKIYRYITYFELHFFIRIKHGRWIIQTWFILKLALRAAEMFGTIAMMRCNAYALVLTLGHANRYEKEFKIVLSFPDFPNLKWKLVIFLHTFTMWYRIPFGFFNVPFLIDAGDRQMKTRHSEICNLGHNLQYSHCIIIDKELLYYYIFFNIFHVF